MCNQDVLNNIRKFGIKVKHQQIILEYVNKYGFYRIIECYGGYLKQFQVKKLNTDDVISIFQFDRKLANMLSMFLFDFEQQLNYVAIDEICKFNKLDDNYILTITNNPAYSNLRNKGFADFTNEIYENVKSCNLINNDLDAKQLPLRILSVSWSFHTLISFVYLQDEQIITNIANRFNIVNSVKDFISVCHSIRKFRNILSHNGMFYASKLNYYRREFNCVLNNNTNTKYDIDTDINIYKLMLLLSKMLNYDIVRNEFHPLLKQLKLKKRNKKMLMDVMGFKFSITETKSNI